MSAAERIEWWSDHPVLLWCPHPCEEVWDALDVDAANDNSREFSASAKDLPEQPNRAATSNKLSHLPLARGATASTRQGRGDAFRSEARTSVGRGLTKEDVEVGLQYFGFRFLNPLLGRWISPDPLEVHSVGASRELNVYAYVSGTVLKSTDPLGLCDGCEGQSGAGAGTDGNDADSGADAAVPTGEGPQQQAAREAEEAHHENANREGFLAGMDAANAASSGDPDEGMRHWQSDVAKEAARQECGADCAKYTQDFDAGYQQGIAVGLARQGAVALLGGLAARGSPKSTAPQGGKPAVMKPPPRAEAKPAAGASTPDRTSPRTTKSDASGRRPDFVVGSDGTAVPVSQSRMRAGFDRAGIPSRPATESKEGGRIHTVDTPHGPTDVRTMEGGTHHPRRAVTTRAGTNDPVRITGERFRANESRPTRRAGSHLEQDP